MLDHPVCSAREHHVPVPGAPAPLRLAVLMAELHQLLDGGDPRLGLPRTSDCARANTNACMNSLTFPFGTVTTRWKCVLITVAMCTVTPNFAAQSASR